MTQEQQKALDALAFICRTIGYLEVVPPYGDALSRTKEADKAIALCGELRAALSRGLYDCKDCAEQSKGE